MNAIRRICLFTKIISAFLVTSIYVDFYVYSCDIVRRNKIPILPMI